MSPASEIHPYPPLPVGEDAIRILTLEPGEFPDPLVCTLTSVAFSSKPTYVALSYTWGDPYPDNAVLPTSPNEVNTSPQSSEAMSEDPKSRARVIPRNSNSTDQRPAETPLRDQSKATSRTTQSNRQNTINLDGRTFQVGHNLCLALLHLRSRTHPLVLWVDAVCINQGDMEERNEQVTIMSFIYQRARKVVVWLGMKENKNQPDLFRYMSFDWNAGQTRQLATFLDGKAEARYSSKPDQITFTRLAESSYWARLWVVQEACLPMNLVFVYGSKIWAYEELEKWKVLKAARAGPPRLSISQEVVNDKFEAMLRLFDTRNAKFTDTMKLESLIEVFSKNGCAELRDRVYGLLGLANDTYTFATVDSGVDSVEEYINSLDPELESLPEPQRGVGSFKVDYSRSFYDIWVDVVKFVFFRTKNIEGWYSSQVSNSTPKDAASTSDLLQEERRIRVVRTAGVIQEAFAKKWRRKLLVFIFLGKVSPFYSSTPKFKKTNKTQTQRINERPIIRAIGYLSGEIVHLGPEYTSLVGSFRAQQEWLSSWEDHYRKPSDLETLRRVDEKYTAKIMGYEDKDLARTREIRNPSTVAWRVAGGGRPKTSDPSYAVEFDKMWESMHKSEESKAKAPRICLGTDYLITLVPSAVMVGDVVVRFWNCDAAILMRPINPQVVGANSSFMLVGRADVAEVSDRKATPGFDIRAEEGLLGNSTSGFEKATRVTGAVYVDMNFQTLQIITASIST